MTIEKFQKLIMKRLKSGMINYIKEGTIADYVLVYKDDSLHGVTKEWLEPILPLLEEIRLPEGSMHSHGLILKAIP